MKCNFVWNQVCNYNMHDYEVGMQSEIACLMDTNICHFHLIVFMLKLQCFGYLTKRGRILPESLILFIKYHRYSSNQNK